MLTRLILLACLLPFLLFFVGCTARNLPPTSDLVALHLEGLNQLSQHKFEAAEAALLTLVSESHRAFVPRFNLAVAQLNQAEKGIDRAL
ncbi:TPA: hypothetical protein EYO57_34575, partial [Candidatus Poribacteria bacterium]|nr:hypothetical protein [Candidatus Poribacteria bacterium]